MAWLPNSTPNLGLIPSPSLSSRTPSSHAICLLPLTTRQLRHFTGWPVRPAKVQYTRIVHGVTVRRSRLATPTYYYSSITLGSVFADPSHVFSHPVSRTADMLRCQVHAKTPYAQIRIPAHSKHARRRHARRRIKSGVGTRRLESYSSPIFPTGFLGSLTRVIETIRRQV